MEIVMKLIRLAFGLLVALLCLSSVARAQDTGTFTGTVHDSTGAVVGGAEVTVSNSSIGLKKTVTTNADGEWVVPYLPIGAYDIGVSAKGFKKFEAKGVALRVGQKARVDVDLQVGAVSRR
jgi:type 1 fimbria pilin